MNLLQIHEPGQTPLPHADTAAVGIDLGTTHSVVAVASEGNAEVLHNIHGHALVPSVVYFAPDGSVEVGYPAKLRHERGEKNVFASIKRQMGKSSDAAPVKVSAEILKELKKNAERALGKEVTKAVITVPAYFDDAARTATKDAARLAGLEVLRLINEPTAAALAYGLDNAAEGIYAIYDLGGGTFDISLLNMEKGVFQVLATGGDTQLGGDDIDALIPAKAGVPSRDIKERLSDALVVEGVTREQLEALAKPFIERTLAICERAFADAKLSKDAVKGIVLVGGSTRMPLVRRMVGEWFGKTPLTNVNPDEVVAIGAAIQAQGLTQGSDNLLLDVIPLSLGLETMGGIVEKLIYRNTPIPVSISQEFTTYQDGQDGISVHVVQGEREMAAHNRSLAKFDLTGIPPLPAGIARVKVTFTVDADGLLTVSAQEAVTGKEQVVHVKPSYGLPPEHIEAMLRESMEHARKDITERLLVEARVEAERVIFELDSALASDGDLLSDAEKAQLARQVTVVRNVIQGENRDYIDAEAHELARLAQPFAEKRMDRAVAGALKGASINSVVSGQLPVASE